MEQCEREHPDGDVAAVGSTEEDVEEDVPPTVLDARGAEEDLEEAWNLEYRLEGLKDYHGNDPVKLYMRDAIRTPLLSPEEEQKRAREVELARTAWRRAVLVTPFVQHRALAKYREVLETGKYSRSLKIGPSEGGGLLNAENALQCLTLNFPRMERFSNRGEEESKSAMLLMEQIPLREELLRRWVEDARNLVEMCQVMECHEAGALESEAHEPMEALMRRLEDVRALEAAWEEARQRLVQPNTRLVVAIARGYHAPGLDDIDLIGEGNAGLMRAADGFEADRGFKFSTYAWWWVRERITRAIIDKKRTIRVPSHNAATLSAIARFRIQYLHEYGRDPTPEEMAEGTGIKIGIVQRLLRVRNTASLDSPLGDSDESFGSQLADERSGDPSEQAREHMQLDAIRESLRSLNPREAEVMIRRCGLPLRVETDEEGIMRIMDDPERHGRSQTLEEAGEDMRVTRARVQQLEDKATGKLRLATHPHRVGLHRLDREQDPDAALPLYLTPPAVEKDDPLSLPLSAIGLPSREVNALEGLQIFTVGDYLTCTDEEILSVPNFGEKLLGIFDRRMRELGLERESTRLQQGEGQSAEGIASPPKEPEAPGAPLSLDDEWLLLDRVQRGGEAKEKLRKVVLSTILEHCDEQTVKQMLTMLRGTIATVFEQPTRLEGDHATKELLYLAMGIVLTRGEGEQRLRDAEDDAEREFTSRVITLSRTVEAQLFAVVNDLRGSAASELIELLQSAIRRGDEAWGELALLPRRLVTGEELNGQGKTVDRAELERRERVMAWAAEQGFQSQTYEEALGEVMAACRPLSLSAAKELRSRIPPDALLDVQDFAEEGCLGFRDALEAFDPAHGTKFQSFAYQRVRGRMIDAMREADWLSKVARKKVTDVDKTIRLLEGRLKRPPTDGEIADHLGIAGGEVLRIRQMGSWAHPISLSHAVCEDGSGKTVDIEDLVADGEAPDPSKDTPEQLREWLLYELPKLATGWSKKERRIFILYYYEELTMKEIGTALGLTESRVSQIHGELLRRVREAVARSPGMADTLFP